MTVSPVNPAASDSPLAATSISDSSPKNPWDERYNTDVFIYGTEANLFLQQQAARIPPGSHILCLAEGEGRNAVFLAGLNAEGPGHTVTAVDLSAEGLKKAQQLARQQQVTLHVRQLDLARLDLPPDSFDAIISIFAHIPPAARQHVHQQVVQGLKPGGLFILEAYTPDQLNTSGTGGPPASQPELFMQLARLRQELAGLHEIHGLETLREVNEGTHHQGTGAVVQYVARKPASADTPSL